MKKILFVGEHPLSHTGNGNMMAAIIGQVDYEQYQISCFASNEVDPTITAFNTLPFTIIPARDGFDHYGAEKLLKVIKVLDFDVLCFVGVDVWRYGGLFERIDLARTEKGFKWVGIFPYDIDQVRQDWLYWINLMDIPCVYSQFGFDLLKDHVPHLRYFRPPLYNAEIFEKVGGDEAIKLKGDLIGEQNKGKFLFGFIGSNQARKDLQKLIHAFFIARESLPEVFLYLHTDVIDGTYHPRDAIEQYGGPTGLSHVAIKQQGRKHTPSEMVKIYNAMDCLVNCTVQEGLSWTVLEAMLCGTPVIASETTAQTEIVKGAGILVAQTESAFVPMVGDSGITQIEGKACSAQDIASRMVEVAINGNLKLNMSIEGHGLSREWLSKIDDINAVFNDIEEPRKKIQKTLFAQQAAAGDVLMTTRCLKAIKSRHPDHSLVYMTETPFMDIVEGNPYIDEVIPWNRSALRTYETVYSPHNDRILHGHWGRGSPTILSDLYWKIIGVDPDDFFIEQKKPDAKVVMAVNDAKKYSKLLVVHTTGGDQKLRRYRRIPELVRDLQDRYFTIQIGGRDDAPAGAHMNLSGKLSFRESAWVLARASIAVTIDSFMSHLAGALGISQVCLFGPGSAPVVRPKQMAGTLICRTPDYIKYCVGMGPCSGHKRDCINPCINTIKPKDILADITTIEVSGGHMQPSVIMR